MSDPITEAAYRADHEVEHQIARALPALRWLAEHDDGRYAGRPARALNAAITELEAQRAQIVARWD